MDGLPALETAEPEPNGNQETRGEAHFQSQDQKWQKKAKSWSMVRCGLCTH